VYPGGKNVYYSFDSNNHMTNVTDWAGRKTSVTYDLAGHLTSITRPNGTQRIINYDKDGEATNIIEEAASKYPIAFYTLGWTNSGRIAWEFGAPLPHTNAPPSRTMTYDNDNRLATFKLGTSSTLTVGSDADGNLTNAPLTTNALAAYAYDARNRLLNVGGVTNFYDAMNNRYLQTQGTNATMFVVNPNAKLPQVLMRIKNGVTNYYVYGAGLLYQVTEAASGTNVLTYHYDYRGSTVALTDTNGNITDRIEYSLYATTTYRAGTNDTPFLFNGRYGVQTDSNGLLYMRARYYNPYLCRFLNADPSGFSGGLNFYAYAGGNPVSYLDPFGLNKEATGDTDFTWTGLWNGLNSLLAEIVPGATPYNNAVSSFRAGNYGTAALNVVSLIEQDALFFLSDGTSEAVAPSLNATEQTVSQIGNNAVEEATSTSTALTKFFPDNSGFAGATDQTFLMPGQTIDRYGGTDFSRFFSPSGTAEAARALPPGIGDLPLRTFEVVKPFEVQSGIVAPWFNQVGGGIQYMTPVNLDILLNRGILNEITP
jgi:RHS repeat-associated protein